MFLDTKSDVAEVLPGPQARKDTVITGYSIERT